MRITKCLLKQSTIWGAPADHAGILDVNPAASVRGPRYVVKRGKTPVLSHLHAETQSVFSEKERRSETQPRLPSTLPRRRRRPLAADKRTRKTRGDGLFFGRELKKSGGPNLSITSGPRRSIKIKGRGEPPQNRAAVAGGSRNRLLEKQPPPAEPA